MEHQYMTNEPQQLQPSQAEQVGSSKAPQMVERIFARFSAMYGNRFADMWASADILAVKKLWADEIASYTLDEVSGGMTACKARDWPPTLPEFTKLCRPPVNHEKAYHAAINRDWSNVAVYWAATRMGHDLRSKTYRDIKARWEKALDDAIAGVNSGALPRAIPEALPPTAVDSKRATPEIRERCMADIRKMLGRKQSNAG